MSEKAKGQPAAYWTPIAVVLIIAVIVGGLVAWSRFHQAEWLEIDLSSGPEPQGLICIDGAVGRPGYYPLNPGDTIADLIQAAGAVPDQTSVNLTLIVADQSAGPSPQKVDINRADVWLLEALPGIARVKAQAIVDYRLQNGRFRSTLDLLKVPGLDTATYDRIKNLITVSD